MRKTTLRFELGTMLDEDGIGLNGVERAAMGAVATARLADCLAVAGGRHAADGEERTGHPVRVPNTDDAQPSVRRPALPVGAPRNRSDRLFSNNQPVSLSVIFGTGDACDDVDAEAVCGACFCERWQCQCLDGKGSAPLP